jgi:CheY-like chemotaxis protein
VPAQLLVVEDEVIVATELRYRLQRLGYAVPAIVASGAAALQKAAETRPDLVLMDIVLQGNMDGVETAAHIREQFGIPVIYVTAHADDATWQRARHTAPGGYILKPFHERALQTTIEIALSQHATVQRLRDSEAWHAVRQRLDKEFLDLRVKEQQQLRYELHNDLGQHLTGVAFLSHALAQNLAARASSEATAAAEITGLINQAIRQTDTLARRLYPMEPEAHGGLVVALQELAMQVENLCGITCHITGDQAAYTPDHAVALQLYYIAHEAVHTAITQRQATQVVIALAPLHGRLTLTVQDNGICGPEALVQHPGWLMLHYRASLVGAALEVQQPVRGTTIVRCTLSLPSGFSPSPPP